MEPRKSAQGISDEDCERIDVEFPKLFYVSSMDAVKKVIQNYELRTKSQFAAHRETKNFATNWSIFSALPKHRITWQDREGRYEKIPHDGVPFIVVGKRSMSCTFGPTYRSKAMEELRKQNELKGKKHRTVPQRSVNCPAQISIREIHKFPEFSLPDNQNTKHQREKMMRELKHSLIKKKLIGERRFYVSLPRMRDHQGHDFEKDVSKLRTDYRVIRKLTDLIYRRVFDPRKLSELITKYVKEELFKDLPAPPPSDARFYPSKRRILNISYNTRVKMQEEGIAVPIPLLTANGANQTDRRLQEKRGAPSDTTTQSSPTKRNKRVSGDHQLVDGIHNYAVPDSSQAVEVLLMLDKPTQEENMEIAGEEEVGFSSDEEDAADIGQDEDSNLDVEKCTSKQSSENTENIVINSNEVMELHPEKQSCLDLLEKIKPLIVFSNQSEPVARLKLKLEESIQELEGCFG